METRGIEYRVGLFILATLVATVVVVIGLGGFSFRDGYQIYVEFSYSGNLKPGAPVKLAGIKVGKVESVTLASGEVDEATHRRILVRAAIWLEDRVQETVRSDAEFFVNTSGVLGEQYLEVVPGTGNPLPPGSIVRGVDPPRTDLIIARLYTVLDSLSHVLTEDRDSIRNFLTNGAGAVGELNSLLANNQEAIGEFIHSTKNLADEATVSLKSINAGIDAKTLQRAMQGLTDLFHTATSSLRKMTPHADELLLDAIRVTRLLSEANMNNAMRAVNNASELADHATKLVDNVNGAVTYVRSGNGTAGALLMREEIYADLREMLRDLKKNPWKFFWKE